MRLLMVVCGALAVLLVHAATAAQPLLRLVAPLDGHRYEMSVGGAGVDVPLHYEVHDFDLSRDGEVCWSIFRVHGESETLHHAPSCFTSVESLQVRALPPGTFRVRGSLVSPSGAAVAYARAHVFTVHESFVASYDWQPLAPQQQVPPGLQVTLPLDGSGLRRARIPPLWRLQLDVGPTAGFFRYDMTRSTTVLEVLEAAAEHVSRRCRFKGVKLPADTCLVLVKDGERLVHWHTVEQVDWFNQQREIQAGLQRCSAPAHHVELTWDVNSLAH